MTGEKEGLTKARVAEILRREGENEIFRPARVSFFAIARHEVTEPMILLLLFVGVVYAVLGRQVTDAITIFAIIALLVCAEVWNEYRAKKAIAALGEIAAPKARVRREGEILEVDAREVVPGDLIVLAQGTKIAADGSIVHGVDLQADESALTGESFPIRKNARDPVFAGTVVMAGEGIARVSITGKRTRIGAIALSAEEIRPPKTRLQLAMKDLAGKLVYIAGFLVVAITVLGIFRGQDPETMFLTGLSLAFATIPEELPIIITMVLGLGAYRLSRNNFLVKKLKAAETLGDTTVIVTDKTGTITEGKMKVAATYPPDDPAVIRQALLAIPEYTSNPVDNGIRDHARTNGILPGPSPILHKRDFGDGRQTRALVREVDGRTVLLLTGAPEEVFSRCREIPEDVKEQVETETGRGRRVIAVAAKSLDQGGEAAFGPGLEQGLVLAGIVSFEDPPRPGVAETIGRASSAGIRTVMVTGDHPATAQFIAGQVGIRSGPGRVVSGEELEKTGDDELRDMVRSVSVFARATPQHKYRIVSAFQKNGEIVAVTGDGINDALALKGADIGIAMGVRGTDVARDAAEVVLADDNYITITTGIYEGRKFFQNLKKGIVYYLSIKTALVLIFLLPVIAALPLPFSPIQIILLELFMDLGASAGFVAEPGEARIIARKPGRRSEKVIDRKVAATILAKGVILFAAVTAVYLVALALGYPFVLIQTCAIAAWFFGHIVMAYFTRSEEHLIPESGLFANPVINLWGLGAIAALLAGMYLPFLQTELNLGPLAPLTLAAIAAGVGGAVALGEIIRRKAQYR
jgi:Ca2+-transporting ATPase